MSQFIWCKYLIGNEIKLYDCLPLSEVHDSTSFGIKFILYFFYDN